MAITRPRSGGSTARGAGELRSSERCVLGVETDHYFDDDGREYQTVVGVQPSGTPGVYGTILSTSLVTQNFFDSDGNVVKTIDPGPNGTATANTEITQRKYDSDGNLTQVTDARNLVTQYFYDDFGQLVET